MGSSISSYVSPTGLVDNVTRLISRKRKYEDIQESIDKVIDVALHTPKRKKLESTAQYIYKVLFKEGKNSDIIVHALGHEFFLHKVYLCQSPYFASMFGGSWLETTKNYISIDVVDPLITIDSLKTVFGSLYNDEVTLNPAEIVPILATATMFQLDGILEKCTEVMIETINTKTALEYYNAACQYGDSKLKEVCIEWFLVNLMTHYYSPPLNRLKIIPVPLMTKLISHPDLFVMKTEITVYVMLVQWMYLQLHPETADEITAQEISLYFTNRKEEVPFLLTEEGQRFAPTFQGLRIQNLVSHHIDVELILRDNIIPKSWTYSIILQQWTTTLKINQNEEKGPVDCPDELFLMHSLRCGRTLEEKERHVWRWTGFHYGIDLIMIADDKTLSVKRNHRPEFEQLLSLQTVRHLTIRVTVVTLNEQRQISYKQSSGIKTLTLAKGEEVSLLTFEKNLTFPLYVSANILYTTPNGKETKVEFIQTVT